MRSFGDARDVCGPRGSGDRPRHGGRWRGPGRSRLPRRPRSRWRRAVPRSQRNPTPGAHTRSRLGRIRGRARSAASGVPGRTQSRPLPSTDPLCRPDVRLDGLSTLRGISSGPEGVGFTSGVVVGSEGDREGPGPQRDPGPWPSTRDRFGPSCLRPVRPIPGTADRVVWMDSAGSPRRRARWSTLAREGRPQQPATSGVVGLSDDMS